MNKNIKFIIITFCSFALVMTKNDLIFYFCFLVLCYESFTFIYSGSKSIYKGSVSKAINSKAFYYINLIQILVGILIISGIYFIYLNKK